jgi:hypothetical protein
MGPPLRGPDHGFLLLQYMDSILKVLGKLNLKVNALLRGKNEEAMDDFEVHLHLNDPLQ